MHSNALTHNLTKQPLYQLRINSHLTWWLISWSPPISSLSLLLAILNTLLLMSSSFRSYSISTESTILKIQKACLIISRRLLTLWPTDEKRSTWAHILPLSNSALGTVCYIWCRSHMNGFSVSSRCLLLSRRQKPSAQLKVNYNWSLAVQDVIDRFM